MPEIPDLPPIADEPLSLVLLAYQAHDVLPGVLEAWNAHLVQRGKPFEIILVDDASPDGTGAVAGQLAGSLPLRVIRHEKSRGEGAALRSGLDAAGNPLVVYAACDPAYGPEHLPALLRQIDRVHLVSGYRAGRPVPAGWRFLGLVWRGFVRLAFNVSPQRLPGWLGIRRHLGQWLARTFFGVRLRDAGCPLRVLRREILPRTPVQSRGTFAHTELLAKANFTGRILSEDVPLSIAPDRPRDGRPDRVFRDATDVFSHPDFGPAVQPVPGPAPSAGEPVASPEPPASTDVPEPVDGGEPAPHPREN